jgi:vesicle-associated membrane protein 4
MHQNITKVAERGERLDALQDKTGTFLSKPIKAPFQKADNQTISQSQPKVSDAEQTVFVNKCGMSLTCDLWVMLTIRWKDMRMRIIIGIGICVLLVVIIVPIVKA